MKKKYSNYVVTFCDGRIKIGMTGNLQQRMKHYKSQAKTTGAGYMVWFASSPFAEKHSSLVFERLMCNSFKHITEYGRREWISGDFSVFKQVVEQYEYVRDLFVNDGEEIRNQTGYWKAAK